MRIKTELWVKAFVRRVNAEAAAFVVSRGDSDGGAVFICVNRLDGTACLYGPAAAGLSETASERRFEVRKDGTEAEIAALIAREREFDTDLWVVEVEDRGGRHFLDDWLISR